MPNTIIFTANSKGRLKPAYEIPDDTKGCVHIWNTVAQIHMGRDVDPKTVKSDLEGVFQLIYSPDVLPYAFRLVLASALDGAVVFKSDLIKYNEALYAFISKYPTDNLMSQLQFLQLRARDKDCLAVAWSQTSQNKEVWTTVKKGIRQKYNLLKDKGHFNVFEEVVRAG